MKVNRESGRALTVKLLLKPIVILFIFLAFIAALYVVLACLTDAEISWTAQEKEDGSFALYPYISPKQRHIGILPVWNFDFVHDKFDDARNAWSYCNDLYYEMNDRRPYRLEAQYVVLGDSAKISVFGYYTQDGEQVDISREFPLRTVYFKNSDYGPLKYTEKLMYLPDDIRSAHLAEIAENRAEIEDLLENGTSLRQHRVFYTVIFSCISLCAIFLLLRYYKKHHPIFTLESSVSGNDPTADFYYVLPSPNIDSKLFGRINVMPEDYLIKEYNDALRAVSEMKKICESHREDLPASFEGTYCPTVEGAQFELRGYYTEGGIRKDVHEKFPIERAIFDEPFFPEHALKPDLSWKWDVR